MQKPLSSMLLAIGLFLAANAAAAPITFHWSIPNADGVNNAVAFADQTVEITIEADTSQIISLGNLAGGGPGSCVLAASTMIAVGGAAPSQAITPAYFCANVNATIVGVFTSNVPNLATIYFAGDYSEAGISDYRLGSDFPRTLNSPGNTKATSSPLQLAGGGTARITAVPDEGTAFTATLGAAAGPTLGAETVPALGEFQLAALIVLMAVAGMWAKRRAAERAFLA